MFKFKKLKRKGGIEKGDIYFTYVPGYSIFNNGDLIKIKDLEGSYYVRNILHTGTTDEIIHLTYVGSTRGPEPKYNFLVSGVLYRKITASPTML